MKYKPNAVPTTPPVTAKIIFPIFPIAKKLPILYHHRSPELQLHFAVIVYDWAVT